LESDGSLCNAFSGRWQDETLRSRCNRVSFALAGLDEERVVEPLSPEEAVAPTLYLGMDGVSVDALDLEGDVLIENFGDAVVPTWRLRSSKASRPPTPGVR